MGRYIDAASRAWVRATASAAEQTRKANNQAPRAETAQRWVRRVPQQGGGGACGTQRFSPPTPASSAGTERGAGFMWAAPHPPPSAPSPLRLVGGTAWGWSGTCALLSARGGGRGHRGLERWARTRPLCHPADVRSTAGEWGEPPRRQLPLPTAFLPLRG